jgi:hypothetical protein
MLNQAILWLGERFSPEQYLFWTRIQCLMWTSADVVIVYYLLRIANLGRRLIGVRAHRYSYVILVLTLPGMPFIALAQNGSQIFLLELAITVPHFLLILYVLAANYRHGPKAFRRLTTPVLAHETAPNNA